MKQLGETKMHKAKGEEEDAGRFQWLLKQGLAWRNCYDEEWHEGEWLYYFQDARKQIDEAIDLSRWYETAVSVWRPKEKGQRAERKSNNIMENTETQIAGEAEREAAILASNAVLKMINEKRRQELFDLHGMRLVNPTFVLSMEAELQRNTHKGDWKTWQPEKGKAVEELRYHVQKLNELIHFPVRVSEHAADVANIAMKISECFGTVAAAAEKEGGK